MRRNEDPASALAAGRAALGQALRLLPDAVASYMEAARFGLVEAAWLVRTRRDPEPVLAKARADAERAIALNHKLPDGELVAAEACLQIATAQRSRAAVDAGLAHVERAVTLDPRLRNKAQNLRDELRRLRSP